MCYGRTTQCHEIKAMLENNEIAQCILDFPRKPIVFHCSKITKLPVIFFAFSVSTWLPYWSSTMNFCANICFSWTSLDFVFKWRSCSLFIFCDGEVYLDKILFVFGDIALQRVGRMDWSFGIWCCMLVLWLCVAWSKWNTQSHDSVFSLIITEILLLGTLTSNSSLYSLDVL